MSRRKFLFFFVITGLCVFYGTEPVLSDENKSVTTGMSDYVSADASNTDSAGAVSGRRQSEAFTSTPLPSCTLEIVTVPSGAVILLDGKESGVSPLILYDVDSGMHTLTIKKTGHYRKKARIVTSPESKTSLSFELSAPGRLSIASHPTAAAVIINGERKGQTPYTDSLVKPGQYSLRLEKQNYLTVYDSITISSGGNLMRNYTLKPDSAVSDSAKQAASIVISKRKRAGFIAVCASFALFFLAVGIIDKKE